MIALEKTKDISKLEADEMATAYIDIARELIQGVKVLSINNSFPRPCSLLAAQALENTLKAHIAHTLKKRSNSHALVALWQVVSNENSIEIPYNPPLWVKTLSLMHGPNFFFRYQEGEGRKIVDGTAYPHLIQMTEGLTQLWEKVANYYYPHIGIDKIKKWIEIKKDHSGYKVSDRP